MIISNYRISHNKGVSLIELMVAMVIGLLLLTGTAGMFISNKRIYKEQDEMGRLQESARFAMQLLIEDIRMAGYAGCSDDISEVTNHLKSTTAVDLLSFSNAIEGVNDADPANPANTPWEASNSQQQVASMIAGTDGISVRYLDPTDIRISSPMPNVSAELKVTTTGDLLIGDIVALSDCDSADIFQLTQVQVASDHLQHRKDGGTPGNKQKELTKKYDTNAGIMRFVSNRYFIGTGLGGGPALFRIGVNDAAATELIDGVQNMQILYGEDRNNNDRIADVYVNAAAVLNWDNVVGVKLIILFRTIDENFANLRSNRNYDLLGTNVAVNDHHRRRTVTAVVQIRNRTN